MTAALIAAFWLGGGALFVHAALANPNASPEVAETSRNVLAGLLRCEAAALIAVAAFLVIWPAVFVGAKVEKWRSR